MSCVHSQLQKGDSDRSVRVAHKLTCNRKEEMKLLDRCRGQIAGRQIRGDICTENTTAY